MNRINEIKHRLVRAQGHTDKGYILATTEIISQDVDYLLNKIKRLERAKEDPTYSSLIVEEVCIHGEDVKFTLDNDKEYFIKREKLARFLEDFGIELRRGMNDK